MNKFLEFLDYKIILTNKFYDFFLDYKIISMNKFL